MPLLAVNHMTAPRLTAAALLDLAGQLGCVGVEIRNDLDQPLFDGATSEAFGQAARRAEMRILAVAEVKAFNVLSDGMLAQAEELARVAKACGAEGLSLIPRCDGQDTDPMARSANLRSALRALKPILEDAGLFGFVEPLGFEASSLRHKSEVLDAAESIGGSAIYRLIHDTFHHHIAGETEFFARQTAIVHVSGISVPGLSRDKMLDKHRGFVDADDRLDNIGQLARLLADGFSGPVSVEAFSPDVHALDDAREELGATFALLQDSLGEVAA